MTGFIDPGKTWRQKAEDFVRTLEIGSVDLTTGGRNTQTGHVVTLTCRGSSYLDGFAYTIDGIEATRDDLVTLYAGEAQTHHGQ
jgi:hypothetical protein